MRTNLGAKPLLLPQPVLVIGTYDKDDNPDIMLAAWGSVADYDKIFLCIDHTHKSGENILLNKSFTVSIGTKDFVKNIDYIGLVSLHDEKDKIINSKFTTIKSNFVKGPIINELPLTLECEVLNYDTTTDYILAKVVNTSIEEQYLTNGKVDIDKLKPILYDAINHTYRSFGDVCGYAFKDGNELKK